MTDQSSQPRGEVQASESSAAEHYEHELRFVDLGGAFPKSSFWSNDPKDMKIDLYFSADPKVPGLSEEYNIKFRPIIVKPDPNVGYTFLLTDSNGHYYIWNEVEADMWRFRDENLRQDDAVYKVRTESYGQNEVQRQFYDNESK